MAVVERSEGRDYLLRAGCLPPPRVYFCVAMFPWLMAITMTDCPREGVAFHCTSKFVFMNRRLFRWSSGGERSTA